ncbi:hypothetical protein [Haloarchaeobius amylolyticus]|uniref:hypothetical protein n=1 Tax=Haloarchaeobius amylolyticus TaxID=1198296 RepID=UPI0022719CC6|nr:hypothetical protein [Haloarchaeobius amylolyticus]
MGIVNRNRHDQSASAKITTVRYLAAGLAFTSQAIHLWILPEAFVVTLLPGLFFLFVGMSQGLLGVSLLFRPGKWTLGIGILLNALIVTVWITTRIVSLPAITGSAQLNIDLAGIGAAVAEIILVLLLLKLLAAKR